MTAWTLLTELGGVPGADTAYAELIHQEKGHRPEVGRGGGR